MRWLLLTCALPLMAAEPTRLVVAPDWPQLPESRSLGLCAGVGVDGKNRVFVFHRCGRKWTNPFPADPIAEPTVTIFDGASGRVLGEWGAGQFIMPHGLSIDQHGDVWLTDVGLHQVFKFTPEGRLLMTLGERGVPGDDPSHFNLPTDVAVLPDGSFYVSDGYKNTRVVKFGVDGAFQFQWGTKGKGAGEFHLPHGVAINSKSRVIVCDRENERLQVFDKSGSFISEWKGPQIGKPYGVACFNGRVFVIDGGSPSVRASERGKAVMLDEAGQVMETFGSAGKDAGQFQLGHDIAVGPDGAVYVAEGTGARVQKFVVRK